MALFLPLCQLANGLTNNPAPDVDHLVALLGDWDKIIGWHHAVCRLPAYQGFEAAQLEILAKENGLVEHNELPLTYRPDQAGLHTQALFH